MITRFLIILLSVVSCARGTISLSGGSDSNLSGECVGDVEAILTRVGTADPKVGETVLFKVEASGCTGRYVLSDGGSSFTNSSPFYYTRTYNSVQTYVTESILVRDATYASKIDYSIVQFNVVSVPAGSIACNAAFSPSAVVLGSDGKATANLVITPSPSASILITSMGYLSGGGQSLSPSTPVPSVTASATPSLSIILEAAGQHVFNFTVQDASTPSLTASCNATIQANADSTLVFSDSPMAQYGTVASNSDTVSKSLTVQNPGTSNITLQTISLSSTPDFTIASGGSCAASTVLAPGGECTVNTVFAPTAGSGTKSATLSIQYTSASSTVKTASLALQGTKQLATSVVFSPSSLDFGTVNPGTPSAAMNISILSTGTGVAKLLAPVITNSAFQIQTNTCPWDSNGATLAAGASCTLPLIFSANSAGSYAATITLSFKDEAGTTISSTIDLTGIAQGSTFPIASGKGGLWDGSTSATNFDEKSYAPDLSTSCAIKAEKLYCWGSNKRGVLGIGNTIDKKVPTLVTGMDSGVTAVAVGEGHVCAIKNGALYCWGDNTYGKLGDGSTAGKRESPTAVIGGLNTGVTHVALGGHTSCAIKSGALYCWGLNAYGRLGLGSSDFNDHSTPTAVPGMNTGVTGVAPTNMFNAFFGMGHVCAIKSGALYCWGSNGSGQLGNGSTSDSYSPVAVVGLSSGVYAVSTQQSRTCAIQNGALKCWGFNPHGELGDGTTTSRGTPGVVQGMDSGVTSVGGGSFHQCAVKSSKLYCWGWNTYGQIGDATKITRTTPVAVSNMSTDISVVGRADDGSTCAMKGADVYCWGRNDIGQLGNGYTTDASTPVKVALP